jgi:hypothetical protein
VNCHIQPPDKGVFEISKLPDAMNANGSLTIQKTKLRRWGGQATQIMLLNLPKLHGCPSKAGGSPNGLATQ